MTLQHSLQQKSIVAASAQRISAMMLRHWYLLRSSWPRLLDLIYWPTVQMVTWGFLQYYIASNAGFFARAGGTFIGAVLLWDILFRGQLGFSISFLEEMYSRNLGNIMMSPLRPFEFIIALMVISVVRLLIGAVPVMRLYEPTPKPESALMLSVSVPAARVTAPETLTESLTPGLPAVPKL